MLKVREVQRPLWQSEVCPESPRGCVTHEATQPQTRSASRWLLQSPVVWSCPHTPTRHSPRFGNFDKNAVHIGACENQTGTEFPCSIVSFMVLRRNSQADSWLWPGVCWGLPGWPGLWDQSRLLRLLVFSGGTSVPTSLQGAPAGGGVHPGWVAGTHHPHAVCHQFL